jgi:hypothetical protein
LPASLPLVDPNEGAHGGNRVSPVKRAPEGRKAKKGRPGRYYRAANALVEQILGTVGLAGKKRRPGVSRKLRKIREAAAVELGP